MGTKKMISWPLAVLLAMSLVVPTVATNDAASDYLPLAVGNSWTYEHDVYDLDGRYGDDESQWTAYSGQEFPRFTITVERTEVVGDTTYYVISDMPANWPPAPPHFIAGKKLRWEGTHLMERTSNGEQAIYRFDGHGTSYDLPTVEGDNRVTAVAGPNPVPWYSFEFLGNGEGSRGVSFLANYGIHDCSWGILGTDHPLFINEVNPLHAFLGGTQVEYEDALIPTSSSSSTWGEVKQSLYAHTAEGTSR